MNSTWNHFTIRSLAFAAVAALALAIAPQRAGAASSSVSVTPSVFASDNGLSASFTVTWNSTTTGVGTVLFGSGTGCTGLVGTAIETGAPTSQHSVVVTGNQLGGPAGAMPIQPGQTYSFEVVTSSSSGNETDNNGGTCYTVTIPGGPVALASGAVYTETNNASGNSIVVMTHGANGQLTVAETVPTGGKGSGYFLDSQGSVTLSSDGRYLFAVNAGDNTISSFRVTAGGLSLVSTVPSGGGYPESVTSFGSLVYVLNESATVPFSEPPGGGKFIDVAGNISGFTLGADGSLAPLAGSTQPSGVGGREISFDPTGSVLVVTNRTDNNIATFIVGPGGLAETPTRTQVASPSPFGPFGFAFDSAGHMIVADSNTAPSFNPNNPAGASSYSVSVTGTILPLTSFVANTQNITCWMVVVGKYAYSTNAIGATTVAQLPKVTPGTISSYSIASDGTLTLVKGAAGTLPGSPGLPGHFAFDEAASPDGKYLYVLDGTLPPDDPDQAQIDTFAINGDGTLTYVGSTPMLPGGPGFSGIAVSGTLVYTETNSTSGNSIVVLSHGAGGALSVAQTVPSGGKGSGYFLDSQGSVTLSRDGRFLYAVNAGDNTVSSFRVVTGGLSLVSTVPTGGGYPESVTSFGNTVYVLNESATVPFSEPPGAGKFVDAAGNISGFTVGLDGTLSAIAGSTQPAGLGAREISFDPTGKVLVVTNRTDNNIYTYPVGAGGVAGAPIKSPSAGPFPFGPFGFAFDSAGHLIVADSNTGPSFSPNNPAGASSYSMASSGALSPVTAFVPNGQNITCWMIVVGKYAYSTNAIGMTTVAQIPKITPGTISSYRIGPDGSLTLVNGAAGILPGGPSVPGHFAFDEVAGPDAKYLYVLDGNLPPDDPDQAQIDTFAIRGDGMLTYVGSTAPLPGGPGFSGIAAG